ncbi:MAG: putative peptidoglycan glycosyltransferase FtsW [Pseudomonadota bacterium]
MSAPRLSMPGNLPNRQPVNSQLTMWWLTIDRLLLSALIGLALFGVLVIAAASPPVAERIGLDGAHFLKRHLVLLAPTLLAMVVISFLSPKSVRRAGLLLFLGALVMLIITPLAGDAIKGATRWIRIAGFSLQASEFMKPAFAVVVAWMFALQQKGDGFPGNIVALGLCALVAALLLIQPDLGQTFVLLSIFGVQFFLAGLPILLVICLGVTGMAGLVGAYFTFPHVQSRVDRFLDPSSGDTFQVERSLEAFRHGSWFGTGPAQGEVKHQLPDAHADFAFSVLGEEMGLIACMILLIVFGFIVIRGFYRVSGQSDLFVLLATAGILTQFGMQALIHMGSALHLMPTKGMTLPFISYGGSSLLSLGIAMGFVLALTRSKRAVPLNIRFQPSDAPLDQEARS